MRFPRLETLFGMSLQKVDKAALTSVVDGRARESGDLDWKGELYSRDEKGKHELAKDVAALANGTGGVLVLGVTERDAEAEALSPVPLSEAERQRMRQVLTDRITPFLPGVDIRSFSAEQDDLGYYMILVPRSADAPHAVKQGSALGYPVRSDVITRWLTEGEVAAYYRERFVARTQLGQRLEAVFDQGAGRLQRQRLRVWLCMSAVPTLAGDRPSGAASINRAQGFFTAWAERAEPRTASIGNLRALAGVRRAILTENGSYAGTSDDIHLELHHDGGGFAAFALGPEPAFGSPYVAVSRDRLEIDAMSLVSLLSEHAVDTGASGELMLRTQLLLPDRSRTPTGIHAAKPIVGSLERIPGSLTLESTTGVETTVLLGETAGSAVGVVRGAYPLVADILAEFGIAEPAVLRPEGVLRLAQMEPDYQRYMRLWAQQNGLVAESQDQVTSLPGQ